MRRIVKIAQIALCLLVVCATALETQADTLVSGAITQNTIWTLAESPYTLTGVITVEEGATLIIEPSVQIDMHGFRMDVKGFLVAVGTETTGLIRFSHSDLINLSTSVTLDESGNYVSGTIIKNCTISDGNIGIEISTGNVLVEDCEVVGMGTPIRFSDNAKSAIMRRCYVHDNEEAIDIGGSYNWIYNNSVSGTRDFGIYVAGEHNKVENNIVSGNSYGGIRVVRHYNKILNNTVSYNSSYSCEYEGAIEVTASSDTWGIEIAYNIVIGNDGNGIADFNDSTIVDNIILNNSCTGIMVSSPGVIARNIVIGNGSDGIYLTSPNSDSYSTLVNCTVIGNYGYGLHGGYYEYYSLNQNNISGNKQDGIRIGSIGAIHGNNIFDIPSNCYAIRIGQSWDVVADQNYWGTTDTPTIASLLYDHNVDPLLGSVVFEPFLETYDADAPLSPVSGFQATCSNGSVSLSWIPSREPDIAGYIIYWGSQPGFPYANAQDVGNTTSHTMPYSGSFFVTVTAYDQDYDPATDDPATIVNENQTSGHESWYSPEIVAPPMADFTADTTTGIAPLIVTFSDNSTGYVTAWNWDFGDGNTSSEQHPSNTYSSPGTYNVSLTVSGPGGSNTITKADYVVVTNPPPPVADFSATPIEGIAPLTVSFTNLSTGNGIGSFWKFGDGSASKERSPSHVYGTPGTYSVELRVSNDIGSDTEIKSGYITVKAAPPVAGFHASRVKGLLPLTVRFYNDSQNSIDSYSWDFGDGATSTSRSPSHTYTQSGKYTVSLTVSGPGGTDTKTITDYITVNHRRPAADFSATPTAGRVPLTVQFNDLSRYEVTSWEWDFGDGTRSTERNPSHVYKDIRAYTVKLKVTGPGGSHSLRKLKYIVVKR